MTCNIQFVIIIITFIQETVSNVKIESLNTLNVWNTTVIFQTWFRHFLVLQMMGLNWLYSKKKLITCIIVAYDYNVRTKNIDIIGNKCQKPFFSASKTATLCEVLPRHLACGVLHSGIGIFRWTYLEKEKFFDISQFRWPHFYTPIIKSVHYILVVLHFINIT